MTSQRKETILVLEDEASLRRLLALALRKSGYEVLEANMPEEACEIWKTSRDEIRLLITDIVMPGEQTGWDVARSFLKERPSLTVLFMSGYFGEFPPDFAVKDANFLRKPFMPNDFLARVKDLLGEEPLSGAPSAL